MRKCRFNSTGPFFQFALTKLLDVSMQVDHSGALDEPVLLWAIAGRYQNLNCVTLLLTC